MKPEPHVSMPGYFCADAPRGIPPAEGNRSAHATLSRTAQIAMTEAGINERLGGNAYSFKCKPVQF
jgi:hypothetical protein